MIYYLMGKSASGKDTIYKRLMEDTSLGLKRLVLYTTRPRRAGERDGEEYHFIDEERLSELKESGSIIEMRAYNTVHGVWYYLTARDEDLRPAEQDYLAIGTLESFIKTRDFYGENLVTPLLIELDDGVRLQRALDRERSQKNPKYRELCRRFLADDDDFSCERVQEAGIIKAFRNDNLGQCLSEIGSYITDLKR